MARAQTFIIHGSTYDPPPANPEYGRRTGNVGRAGGSLRQTLITHEDATPPPTSAADELDRWTVVLDPDTSNQEEILTKLRSLIEDIETAYPTYAGRTDASKLVFMRDTFTPRAMRAVALLARLAVRDLTNTGL